MQDDDCMPGRVGYSVEQRAKQIGVSRAFLYGEIRRGRLILTKFGRCSRILDSDWNNYLSARRASSVMEAV